MTRQDGFEAWFTPSRGEAAALFEELSDGIENGSVEWGSVSIGLPETVQMELECEPDEDSYEFELAMHWSPVEAETASGIEQSTAEPEATSDGPDATGTAGAEDEGESGGPAAATPDGDAAETAAESADSEADGEDTVPLGTGEQTDD